MRILLLAAWLAAFAHPLVARDVTFQRIEADLGQELGFFVYRAETEIADDEVFVVSETTTDANGEQRRFVQWWVSNRGPKARYSVTLVDSGMFVPGSMHYLLRHGGNRRTIDDASLLESGLSSGGLYLKFGVRQTNRPLVEFDWKAKLLSRDEFHRQYPERKLPELKRGSTSAGSFIVRDGKS